MEEGLVEIDSESYMFCRLCGEEKGKFRIVPTLKEKIKFVFDIDIRLYDGFSQIMCEKCKILVTEYSNIKEKFQQKQTELRSKAKNHIPTLSCEEPEIVSDRSDDKSNTDIQKSSTSKKVKKSKKIKKKRTVMYLSSSSDDEVLREPSPSFSNVSSVKSLEIVTAEPEKESQPTEKESQPTEKESQPTEKESQPKEKESQPIASWKELYQRKYVCRYCDKMLNYNNSIRDHVRSHAILMKKRRHLTRWHSSVRIERFDERSNLTGEDGVVVFSPSRLLSDGNNPDYYITYISSDIGTEIFLDPVSESKYVSSDSDHNEKTNRKRFTCVDVTSDQDDAERPKLRKRIRLQSNASDATVDLQVDDRLGLNAETSNTDNLNDTHEISKSLQNVSALSIATLKPDHKKGGKQLSDFETIKQIVTASVGNMRKNLSKTKCNSNEKMPKLDGDELLKRKLLSIGRKVMVKKGYVSMGLLKFLEQRNLKIQWVAPSAGAAYLRIQTKLTEGQESDNLSGFQPYHMDDAVLETSAEFLLRAGTSKNRIKFLKKQIPSKIAPKVPSTPAPSVATPINPSSLLLPINPPSLLLPISPSSVMLPPKPLLPSSPLLPALPNTTLTRTSVVVPNPGGPPEHPQLLNLLNASPVANPKKAVKKKSNEHYVGPLPNGSQANMTSNGFNVVDKNDGTNCISLDSDEDDLSTETSGTATESKTSVTPSLPPSNISRSPTNTTYPLTIASSSSVMCMPIITSTESLAKLPKNQSLKPVTEQSGVPRLKCKPVSELMSGKNEDKPIVHIKTTNGGVTPSMAITPLKSNHSDATDDQSSVPDDAMAYTKPGQVVLHSISLPNTVTNKPFQYFSQLLGLHSLCLVDNYEYSLTDLEFVNLVKFRLGVHQHPISVMLNLSLEARGSSFRIGVRNRNGEHFNVLTMSALWQWEVLKAFKSESVVAKIEHAAAREILIAPGAAKLFTNLLRSITLVSDGQSSVT